MFVVGTIWVGWAAKLGNEQNVFWLIAIVTFYLPLAAAVIFLNRLMPLEGGLYQWAKFAFNDFLAFMVAWNLWVFAISILAGIGLVVTTNVSYAIGPAAAWMKENDMLVIFVSLVLVIGMVLAATRGLAVGKWFHNAGGLMLMLTFAALILLPLFGLVRGSIGEYHPFTIQVPTFSAYNVNVCSKLALGALTGFEYIAIMAGETRAPARNFGRSVIIAAPIIAAMFILGTSSVVAMVPYDSIDLIAPIPQLLSVGFGPLGVVAAIVPLTLSAMIAIRFAQASVNFAGSTRLPMVAGWDSLLPAWFTRLSETRKTPVNSILFVGAATFVLSTLGLIGVGKQEAFQLLWNSAGIFYALTYLAMFAVPLWGLARAPARPPWWIKLCALSGLLMTILYISLSVLPIIPVGSRTIFALKIVGLIVVTNAIGVALYVSGRRSARIRRHHDDVARTN